MIEPETPPSPASPPRPRHRAALDSLKRAGAALGPRDPELLRRTEARLREHAEAIEILGNSFVEFLDGRERFHASVRGQLLLPPEAERLRATLEQAHAGLQRCNTAAARAESALALVQAAQEAQQCATAALKTATAAAERAERGWLEARIGVARPLFAWVAPVGRSEAGLRLPTGDARSAQGIYELPPEARVAHKQRRVLALAGAGLCPALVGPLLRSGGAATLGSMLALLLGGFAIAMAWRRA
ncbi:MAG TPA: hypothetical protein VN515_01460 [Terriglobales bacterium]|nr:hypothetical protein [Terriglobales bacterium]